MNQQSDFDETLQRTTQLILDVEGQQDSTEILHAESCADCVHDARQALRVDFQFSKCMSFAALSAVGAMFVPPFPGTTETIGTFLGKVLILLAGVMAVDHTTGDYVLDIRRVDVRQDISDQLLINRWESSIGNTTLKHISDRLKQRKIKISQRARRLFAELKDL